MGRQIFLPLCWHCCLWGQKKHLAAKFMALNCQCKVVVPVQSVEQYTGVKWVGKWVEGNSLSPRCFLHVPGLMWCHCHFLTMLSEPLTQTLLSNLQTGADHEMTRLAGRAQTSYWRCLIGYWPMSCLPPTLADSELCFHTRLPAKQMSPVMQTLGSAGFRYGPFVAPGRGM